MDGFPEKYQILSPTAERVLEVAQRFGRFMFGAIDAETAYPSEHRRIPEPQDGEALEPISPTAQYYVDMAKEARS